MPGIYGASAGKVERGFVASATDGYCTSANSTEVSAKPGSQHELALSEGLAFVCTTGPPSLERARDSVEATDSAVSSDAVCLI